MTKKVIMSNPPAEKEEPWPELLGAVARGWCHDKNSSKVMDTDLAKAIAEEVLPLISEAKRRGAEEARKETSELLRKSNDAMQRLLNVYGKPAGAGEK